jgi:hypothetical protein
VDVTVVLNIGPRHNIDVTARSYPFSAGFRCQNPLSSDLFGNYREPICELFMMQSSSNRQPSPARSYHLGISAPYSHAMPSLNTAASPFEILLV